ncbi:DUF4437 domain-containing protein [Shewanella sp. 10N.286.54.B9]|uniref:DUF4437 domain-containing protein n=1 Tax=Shewanella sp. 10N.286.54.B9 TaxID=3229719 RepID=UPI003557E631
MNISTTLIALTILSSISAMAVANPSKLQSEVVSADAVQWGYLNPLRGDKSPGAANLWGDRTKNVPTGMLVRFNKGFSSPAHIHNITYRGVVIEGLMHNDDPNAATMWMPAGSFWTQPAGENHITAANGDGNMIFLEIDSGPYLVKPSAQHFDSGEKPVNLHQSNLVWLNQDDVSLVAGSDAEITTLWGSNERGQLGGTMLKLPAGFRGELTVAANQFRGIVIQGTVDYKSVEFTDEKPLTAGSYFGSSGEFSHQLSTSLDGAMIYIRTDGKYKLGKNGVVSSR